MPEGWEWDESLFAGSAPYYMQGRPPYSPELATALSERLALAGKRVIDIGCGPGLVALLLAPFCAEAVGVDPDRGMLEEAARRADAAGISNVRWIQARAEALPAGLGRFDAAIFAQSFHWMDREHVAATLHDLLVPGGYVVLIADDKRPRPDLPAVPPPYAEPPYEAISELVRAWLGPVQRAGQGTRPRPQSDEERVIAAGFVDFERIFLPGGGLWRRREDDVVAWVWSLSSSAPHLFGDRRTEFEAELRAVLRAASPSGEFADWLPDTEVRVWRRPGSS